MDPTPKTTGAIGGPGFLSTELANTVTHGIGFLLSVAGLVVLVVKASRGGEARAVVACAVYGATLVILYLSSTLYHSFSFTRWKRVFQTVDHAAIYLLVAGTYTPFTLLVLRGGWGWSLFGVIWGPAFFGILYKIFWMGRFRIFSVGLYLGMGWLSLIAIRPLLENLPLPGLVWLAAGGMFYTLGVVFFAWHKLPFHHAVWHLFVMAGSTCHFFSVMVYALPA